MGGVKQYVIPGCKVFLPALGMAGVVDSVFFHLNGSAVAKIRTSEGEEDDLEIIPTFRYVDLDKVRRA